MKRIIMIVLILTLVLISGCKKIDCDQNCGILEFEEAEKITQEQCGNLEEDFSYNENTQTWWFDSQLEKEGCNLACVVDERTKTAEINWRCAGLIE